MPDSHAHPEHNNKRAEYVGRLLLDLKPDVFVNIGDTWDMASLSSYDKGKRDFHGRTYAADIASGLDFNERLFAPLRNQKRRLPQSVFIIGNHEQRIDRALDLSPELVGTISYSDLDLGRDYDIVVGYTGNTPGTIELDGIQFAHFMVSGIMGRPIGGEHPAYTLISKKFQSCVVGHSHVLDYCVRSDGNGRNVQGLVSGCLVDYSPDWAGEIAKLWVPGVSILRNVENGEFDWEWISLKRLEQAYG
jgi:hypothetical protein